MTGHDTEDERIPKEHQGHDIVDTLVFARKYCQRCNEWFWVENLEGPK